MIGGQAVFDYIAFQFFQYIHQLFTNWAKQPLDFDFVKDVVGIIAIIGASIFGYALLAQLVRRYGRRTVRVSENEPYPTMPVNKKLGNPDNIDNGIQIFNRRSHLPFNEFLAEAHQRVDMIAVTFHCVTISHIGLIEDTIYRGIRVTFLI